MAREKQASVTATFRFTVRDTRHTTLHSAEVKVSSAGWSEQNRGLFSVYAGDQSYFQFQPNTTYTLEVAYTPGAVPAPAKELYFAMDNCAFY